MPAAATKIWQFELPKLPYALDALEPHISRETLAYHHGKHHRAYVGQLNTLLEAAKMQGVSLEDLIRSSTGPIFNNAAQVWNHSFYWRCMTPEAGGTPAGKLGQRLRSTFGSLAAFKRQFKNHALEKFGSGWTWLVETPDGLLAVRNTDDADTPLRTGDTALLTCDVWEHAYYIDRRNDRGAYVDAFWSVVDWGFVESNLKRPD